MRIINCSFSLKNVRNRENGHQNFANPMMTSPNCVFCLTKSPKPKDISFIRQENPHKWSKNPWHWLTYQLINYTYLLHISDRNHIRSWEIVVVVSWCIFGNICTSICQYSLIQDQDKQVPLAYLLTLHYSFNMKSWLCSVPTSLSSVELCSLFKLLVLVNVRWWVCAHINWLLLSNRVTSVSCRHSFRYIRIRK